MRHPTQVVQLTEEHLEIPDLDIKRSPRWFSADMSWLKGQVEIACVVRWVQETLPNDPMLAKHSSKYVYDAAWARYVTHKTGFGPQRLLRMVNATMRKRWFVPIWTMRMARRAKGFDSYWVTLVSERRHLIPQYEADGQENMVPLAILTGMNSTELRACVGKGLWKRLLRNSVSRNVLIAHSVKVQRTKQYAMFIRAAQAFPSTLLRVSANTAGPPTEYGVLQQLVNLRPMNLLLKPANQVYARDALRMAARHNLRIGVLRRWQDVEALHERGVQADTTREGHYSTQPRSKPFEMEIDGVVYTLLRSQQDYAEEGRAMHHCVQGYYRDFVSGRYAVLSARSLDGQLRATIGIIGPGIGLQGMGGDYDGDAAPIRWEINQVKGYCNNPVQVPGASQALRMVSEKLDDPDFWL